MNTVLLECEESENESQRSAYFQLIEGRLHIPTIKEFFGLNVVRINEVVYPVDGQGFTYSTFQPGDSYRLAGVAKRDERPVRLLVVQQVDCAQEGDSSKRRASPMAEETLGLWVLPPPSRQPNTLMDLTMALRQLLACDSSTCWLFKYKFYSEFVPIMSDTSLQEALSFLRKRHASLSEEEAVLHCRLYVCPAVSGVNQEAVGPVMVLDDGPAASIGGGHAVTVMGTAAASSPAVPIKMERNRNAGSEFRRGLPEMSVTRASKDDTRPIPGTMVPQHHHQFHPSHNQQYMVRGMAMPPAEIVGENTQSSPVGGLAGEATSPMSPVALHVMGSSTHLGMTMSQRRMHQVMSDSGYAQNMMMGMGANNMMMGGDMTSMALVHGQELAQQTSLSRPSAAPHNVYKAKKESRTRHSDGRFKSDQQHQKKMADMVKKCADLFDKQITEFFEVVDHKKICCLVCNLQLTAYSAYHTDCLRKHFLRHHETLLRDRNVDLARWKKAYEAKPRTGTGRGRHKPAAQTSSSTGAGQSSGPTPPNDMGARPPAGPLSGLMRQLSNAQVEELYASSGPQGTGPTASSGSAGCAGGVVEGAMSIAQIMAAGGYEPPRPGQGPPACGMPHQAMTHMSGAVSQGPTVMQQPAMSGGMLPGMQPAMQQPGMQKPAMSGATWPCQPATWAGGQPPATAATPSTAM